MLTGMAHLPDEAVRDFQAIWKKKYGEELSWERAAIRAEEVFSVLRIAIEKGRDEETEPSPTGPHQDRLRRMRTTISISH